MKSVFTYLCTSLLFIGLSLNGVAQNSREGDQRKVHYDNVITIKLKEGLADYSKQKGRIQFGIESLDKIVNQYSLYNLEKRFKYNSNKTAKEMPVLSRIYKVQIPEQVNIQSVIRDFTNDENIEYAERIPISYPMEIPPDDPEYEDSYYLPLIMAEEAWEIHRGENGTEDVVVAVVDTGTDWIHEDLVEHVWENSGEDLDGDGTIQLVDGEWVLDPDDINGVDDDGNGKEDDLIGWDFYEADLDDDSEDGGENPNPFPNEIPHGTRCTGIVAGVTNNGIGISSIAYNGVKFMPINVSDEGGLYLYDYDGIMYAAEMGADIISCSFGQLDYAQASQDVLHEIADMGSIVVAAAGNDGPGSINYPADYFNVVSVANTDSNDELSGDASTNLSVDVCAPGVGIRTTSPDNEYYTSNGSSFSSPIAVGCLALLKSYHPDWSNDELIAQLVRTADNIDAENPGFENFIGTGRVNAYEMLLGENFQDPFLKFGLWSVDPDDEDGDGLLEAGESVMVNLSLRNYMQSYGSDGVEFTLTTEDENITIVPPGTATLDVFPDTLVHFIDQFEIIIDQDATVSFVDFNLHAEADIPITVGQDIPFRLLIEPSGYFVYDGLRDSLPDQRDFSGEYIYNYMLDNGYPSVYGDEDEFPASLVGFDGVFLCYGNYASLGAELTDEMSDAIIEFTNSGGDVYLEGGDNLGFYQPNNAELFEIFGVATVDDGTESGNPISFLEGQSGSIMDGVVFEDNTQESNSWIDSFTPSNDGISAFVEGGYGVVAIQHDAVDYQSFIFSYALKHLSDGNVENGEVLQQIINFFEGTVSVNDLEQNSFGVKVFPNPSRDFMTLQYTLDDQDEIRLEIFNTAGMLIRSERGLGQAIGQQEYVLDVSNMPAGVYSYRLIGNKGFSSGNFSVLR